MTTLTDIVRRRWQTTLPDRPDTPGRTENGQHTVTCHTPGCPNHHEGPWRIVGSADEHYHCAMCGNRMRVTPGWADGWENEPR